MNSHKTWSKKDLLEIIDIYLLPLEDPKDYNKSELSEKIFKLLEDFEIEWSAENPEINETEDLIELDSFSLDLIIYQLKKFTLKD